MRRFAFIVILLCSCTGHWKLREDNDIFNGTTNYDRSYTQGAELSNTREDKTGSHTFKVGQLIYTPYHKRPTEYIPDERPYAGYLYGGYDAHYVRSPNVQDTVGFDVGMVGPHSYAEQAQNGIHRLIGDNQARGWDNQIHDELGVIGTFERSYMVPVTQSVDVTNNLGGNFGNVFTQIFASSLARVGYNLPNNFYSGRPIFPRVHREEISVYAFGSSVARGVARNITLDGNTFRDSASIDKYPFVIEGRLGFEIKYKAYSISYSYIKQSKEFKGDAHSDFGEISIGWGGW